MDSDSSYHHRITGVYARIDDAEQTLQRLVDAGLPRQRLNLLQPEYVTHDSIEPGSDRVLKDVLVDGAVGTAVGTGLGALTAAVMAAANVTLFVAAPVLAPLALLGWGASIGGVVGAAAGARSGLRDDPYEPDEKDASRRSPDDAATAPDSNALRENRSAHEGEAPMTGRLSLLVEEVIKSGHIVLVAHTLDEEETATATAIIRDSVRDGSQDVRDVDAHHPERGAVEVPMDSDESRAAGTPG